MYMSPYGYQQEPPPDFQKLVGRWQQLDSTQTYRKSCITCRLFPHYVISYKAMCGAFMWDKRREKADICLLMAMYVWLSDVHNAHCCSPVSSVDGCLWASCWGSVWCPWRSVPMRCTHQPCRCVLNNINPYSGPLPCDWPLSWATAFHYVYNILSIIK